MTVGFTDDKDIFVKYVNNFSYYGDKYWEDYDGKVYSSLTISYTGISYSDFTALCKESK